MFQGIFIDEIESDKKFAELMSTSGRHGLQITFQKPTELMKLAKNIIANSPDLVALDYRFDKPHYSYKAAPLAQQLRDQALETATKDFPIILVANEDNISSVGAHYLFDRCFSKEALSNGNGSSHRLFSEGWTRWWQHRLEDWRKNLCSESLGNMTAKQRVSCLNQKLSLKLFPAISRWKNHTDAIFAFVCDSCHQPTEDQYSVIAFEPLPYTFVYRKHICWKCVETGEFAENGLEIDDGEEFIVTKIQNGELGSST